MSAIKTSDRQSLPHEDRSHEPMDHSDESRPLEIPATKPKTTFQWPPECLWPFIDREYDRQA
jgi:hypothetical protein